MKLLEMALERRAALAKERDELTSAVEARKTDTTPDPSFTADEEKRFAEIVATIGEIDTRIGELRTLALADAEAERVATEFGIARRAADARIRIKSEPMTYDRDRRNSYFKDLAFAFAADKRDKQALERLERHASEMRVEAETNPLPEIRTTVTTDGTGGEFVPPLWLMADAIKVARAAAVTAELIGSKPVPPGTDSLNVPSQTAGAAVAAYTEDGAVTYTDWTTGSVTSKVETLAGGVKISLKLFETSPLNWDELIYQDLIAAYAVAKDVAVITGSGTTPNIRGLLNTSGVTPTTYTDASPTLPELYSKIGAAKVSIARGRKLPAQCLVVSPERWEWALVQVDSQNRPLVVPSDNGPVNAFAGMTDVRAEGSVGTMAGLPVYVDQNIPTNLGGGTNEDRVIVFRPDDVSLRESSLRTRVLQEVDGHNLRLAYQLYGYIAMWVRYSSAIQWIAGTGVITPVL